VTPGLLKWSEMPPVDGNVLVIVNSPDGAEGAAGELLDRVVSCVPASALHVIATSRWRQWLASRGIADDRILISADVSGFDLELNYFLERAEALHWIATHQFRMVVGTAAHSLYNEEIKDIFEYRVALFLGSGLFLAHALPHPFVYAMDFAHMVRRFGRARKTEGYLTSADGLVRELYGLWEAAGRPARSDDRDFRGIQAVLARHLGEDILTFDESGLVPLRRPDSVEAAAEFFDFAYAKRREAADLVFDLRQEVAHLSRGWRRWLAGSH
jgi:hypothetical protein